MVKQMIMNNSTIQGESLLFYEEFKIEFFICNYIETDYY